MKLRSFASMLAEVAAGLDPPHQTRTLLNRFSHRHMLCLFAQMWPCYIRPLWLRSSADNESHCWHVPVDEVQWQTHTADDDAANWLNSMATTHSQNEQTEVKLSCFCGPQCVFVCICDTVCEIVMLYEVVTLNNASDYQANRLLSTDPRCHRTTSGWSVRQRRWYSMWSMWWHQYGFIFICSG